MSHQPLEPIAVLQETAARLAELFEGFTSSELDEPYAPGKWRRRDVLAHLADVEMAVGFRLRATVGAPGSSYPEFDQDVWAEHYARLDPSLAVEAFRAMRAWNLAWLATLSMQDWLAEGIHPRNGLMSVDDLVTFLAEHDLNHLSQLA